jgi:hypothetical protein
MYRKRLLCSCLVLLSLFLSGEAGAAGQPQRLQIDGPKDNHISITVRDPKSTAEPVVYIGGKQAKPTPGSWKPNPDGSIYFQVELPGDIKPGKTSLEVTVGEEVLQLDSLLEIPDLGVAAGKQPLILKVDPAGGLPSATIRITGRNLGNDLTRITVVLGDSETGLGATSISEPNNEKLQELVFAIPAPNTAKLEQILGNSSIYKNALLTLNVGGRSANWDHVNVVHPCGLWKIAGLSLALVIMLLSPLLAVCCWRITVASVLLLGGFLLFSLISDRCWIFAVFFTGAALSLLYGVRANLTALEPIMKTLFIDKDTNTYSLSKVQAFAWTIVIIGTYVYFAVGRGLIVGRAEIPDLDPGLLSLLSVSYGGLIIARGIGRKNPKNDFASRPPQWTNLITEGNTVSITRLQLLGFTIAAIAVYLFYVSGADLFAKGLPVIPITLSGLLGISQGGYLGGKMVSSRAVNYIIPRRIRAGSTERTIKIFGSGFVDKTKVLLQGVMEASDVTFLNSNSLEVKLPDHLGDVGLKQLVFVPPTDSSFVIEDAFELIAPGIEGAEQLGEKGVIATVKGIELAEGELKASINNEPVRVVKKEGNQYTLESKVDLLPGSTLTLKTTDGDEIGSDKPITKKP